jgi:hypothetical protein
MAAPIAGAPIDLVVSALWGNETHQRIPSTSVSTQCQQSIPPFVVDVERIERQQFRMVFDRLLLAAVASRQRGGRRRRPLCSSSLSFAFIEKTIKDCEESIPSPCPSMAYAVAAPTSKMAPKSSSTDIPMSNQENVGKV